MTQIGSTLQIKGITLPNRLILAPVDGVFDAAFRSLAKRQGVGLTVSEMISARGIVHNSRKLKKRATGAPVESPYCVQLADHDPAYIVEAARWLEGEGITRMIDLNMGCPSRTVTNSGNGAALMKDPERITSILKALRPVFGGVLSVKMRAGWDAESINAPEIARIAEEEGVDFITVHGRTRTQMFGGEANWELISQIKSERNIPVIGNGDIKSGATARRRMEESGCDGVMVARGAFGDPWLLSRILLGDDGKRPTFSERLQTILDHIELQCSFDGDEHGVKLMRKHLVWYVKGLPGAAYFRKRAMLIEDRRELTDFIGRFFRSIIGGNSSVG